MPAMPRSPARIATVVVLAVGTAACIGEPEPFVRTAQGAPQTSALRFQAVDAGTGGPLADGEMTVRYLVRSPMELTASGVETSGVAEPYRVAHEVAGDSLVVELRLEADSYHRLDTVLAVARGGDAGPFTLRMARRLERTASVGPGPERPASTSPTAASATPSEEPTPTPAASGAAPDRAPLEAGNRAFDAGRWNAAVAAYAGMTPPTDRDGEYAQAYQQALTRKGAAHMRVGEYGAALEALEEAVEFDFPAPRAYLRLGEAQCAVGRVDEGKGTLSVLTRVARQVPVDRRPELLALRSYQIGVCSQYEVERAEGTVALVRAGGQAVRDLEAFLAEAEALAEPPPAVREAMADARDRIEAIRTRIRQGGPER